MEKVLPSLGIAGAVLAALLVFVLDGLVALLLLPFLCAAAAVFAFLERRLEGYIAGGVLAVLFLVGIVASTGLTVRGGTEVIPDLEAALAPAFHAFSGLAVAGAALWLRWERVEPSWMRVAGAAVLAVAAIAVFVTDKDSMGATVASTLPAALLCLLGVVPAVLALRGSTGEP